MHREDIKAALRKAYGSLSAFEAKANLPRGSAKDVLRGRAVRRTADAIAIALGEPIDTVFPGRFVGESTKVDSTRGKADTHRLSRAAL